MEQLLLDTLRSMATSLISDTRQRLTGIVGLERFDRGGVVVGRALTVKTRATDNLAVYKAMIQAQPGDFLVIEAGGEGGNAIVGGLIALQLEKLGCVGVIVDGAVRDTDELKRSETLACFAKAVSHKGPFKTGPGMVNVPVSICGQIVNPGDVVVADDDGIVTFPPDEASAVVAAVEERRRVEAGIMSEINTAPREMTWVKRILETAGETISDPFEKSC